MALPPPGMPFDVFMRSRPIELHWAGWSTDTLRLQTAGWQLSAHQNFADESMQIAIRHPRHEVEGITRFERHWDYRRSMSCDRKDLPVLPITLGHKLWVRTIEPAVPWKAIDAEPQLWPVLGELRLPDFVHFAPARAPAELVVPEETVPELLQRIVDMQSGARLERFREQVREERAQRKLIVPHCQIISLREAA